MAVPFLEPWTTNEKVPNELNAGFGTERENLALDAKGNDKWQTP